jgi:hypothetical protein
MQKEIDETREKVKIYYEKVGDLSVDPFQIPETPSDIELHVGWAFDRIRAIVSYENSRRKFGGPNEVLALLGVAAGDMDMDVKFFYYPNIGQWMIEFNNAEDYLNLPHLIKHFGLLWRFKWPADRISEGTPDEVFEEAEVVHEGSGDMFAYDRGGRD